jgi:hypothetical protein
MNEQQKMLCRKNHILRRERALGFMKVESASCGEMLLRDGCRREPRLQFDSTAASSAI